MKRIVVNTSTIVSIFLFCAFVGLYAYAWIADPHLYQPSFRVSFCHINMIVTRLWGGNLIFFNQEAPYTGGTYSMTSSASKIQSTSEKGWDGFGIYFRLIKDASRNDSWWTLMVSLWYPIIIFGILSAVFTVKKLRAAKAPAQSEAVKT